MGCQIWAILKNATFCPRAEKNVTNSSDCVISSDGEYIFWWYIFDIFQWQGGDNRLPLIFFSVIWAWYHYWIPGRGFECCWWSTRRNSQLARTSSTKNSPITNNGNFSLATVKNSSKFITTTIIWSTFLHTVFSTSPPIPSFSPLPWDVAKKFHNQIRRAIS